MSCVSFTGPARRAFDRQHAERAAPVSDRGCNLGEGRDRQETGSGGRAGRRRPRCAPLRGRGRRRPGRVGRSRVAPPDRVASRRHHSLNDLGYSRTSVRPACTSRWACTAAVTPEPHRPRPRDRRSPRGAAAPRRTRSAPRGYARPPGRAAPRPPASARASGRRGARATGRRAARGSPQPRSRHRYGLAARTRRSQARTGRPPRAGRAIRAQVERAGGVVPEMAQQPPAAGGPARSLVVGEHERGRADPLPTRGIREGRKTRAGGAAPVRHRRSRR